MTADRVEAILDPVIVTRDGDGGINLVSNFCRHRGTQVC
jgi:phenylpropionate dioxygenase-like ring-hydroxylating dioxygenase large terminal subunit